MKKMMSDTLVPLAYDRYNPETYPSNPRQREAAKVVELPDSSPDYLMEQYIREIFDGTIDSDISFDKWLDEREQFELGLPYTKNIIDEIKEYAAKEQIENETSGIKSLKRIL